MTTTEWQMRNCGNCKPCLAGARVHGPYPYHWEGRGRRGRKHVYGPGGGGGEGDNGTEPPELTGDEKERMADLAAADARRRQKELTKEERSIIDEIMSTIADLRRLQRRWTRERGAAVAEAEADGLLKRAVEEIVAQIDMQYQAEAAGLRDYLAEQKAALKEMQEAARRAEQESRQDGE